MNFESLGLDPRILKALAEKGYSTPSPIQEQAIPVVLSGRDLMAAAQTGTGKTAGFTLPMLQNLLKGSSARNNQVRALVLTPTRELAQQVADNVALYSSHLPLKSAVVYGGVKINPQMQRLRGGVDVLVATPGRLLDLHNQNALKLNQIEILVLDEADRMLDMGFIHDLKRIMALLPPKRQTLLFSATFSAPIKELAARMVNDPAEVSVSPANTKATSITHQVFEVDKANKLKLLTHLIKQEGWRQVLVFSKTKHGANRIATALNGTGIGAAAIHGNKSQGARTKALADFKSGEVKVLVATDIAARGIDINQLPYVVNFDLPKVPEDYVHRIGRTGRAGETGHAVSFVTGEDAKELFAIERVIGELIPRSVEAKFKPSQPLPESKLDTRPSKPKKPKKPKSQSPEQGSNRAPSSDAKRAPSRKPQDRKPAEGQNASKPAARRPKPQTESGDAPKRTPNRSRSQNRAPSKTS
ncbi:ATP-dependent RNA helicase RhlE [Marinomonas gallaica]|uniref:DEAD-box ATP-dependent RNA helicase RhpA n=1 Tax=Marinomonas gallaica TaxID=1806667 RepID=A0A1C3JWA8_9GAMM|nr:DEAD/DEAH box helicase [Marinomonas gallaica]SBT19445.1 ATP-dependent RNA helicase RhlE [Marinomonas gallaica]SBT22879.1 ATP-dependent RNA helicase RhlE [Marinomonas gallaica]